MSLENGMNGLSAADVAAVVGNQYPMGNGFGLGYGADATWLIILFLFAAMGGWGGNGFGGGNNQFPWMLANNTDTLVTSGFNNANTTSLLGDINNAITSGFAGAEISRCNNTTSLLQTLNNMSAQQASCCCENRLGIADLKYTIATENCADRYEAAQNTRDIIESANRNNQAILDKLCQLELDAKNDKIADLERQLTMANLAASQTAQTSRLLADNAAQTVALEQYLNPTPIPAYVVQNPNCCNQAWNCGCGFNG